MTKTISGQALSQIGIGTYGIGGRGHRDMPLTEKQNDQAYTNAIAYSLDKGSNFTEISLGYGHGESIRLLKLSLDESSLKREDVFITHSFYPRDLASADTMRDDLKAFHEIMDTDYADSTLVTQSLILNFGEEAIYGFLHEILKAEKTRFVSLSNASPSWIQRFKSEFGDKFFAHEGHLSFEVRALQDKGVFDTCAALGVENIIWRPLRRNMTLLHNWSLLAELADRYEKTQSQIILNWMCHLGYRPMVFSTAPKHIDENLSANDFQMADIEYRHLTEFRPQHDTRVIDWEGEGIDDDIVNLARLDF